MILQYRALSHHHRMVENGRNTHSYLRPSATSHDPRASLFSWTTGPIHPYPNLGSVSIRVQRFIIDLEHDIWTIHWFKTVLPIFGLCSVKILFLLSRYAVVLLASWTPFYFSHKTKINGFSCANWLLLDNHYSTIKLLRIHTAQPCCQMPWSHPM